MTDKKKDQLASPKETRVHDANGHAQLARLPAHLRQHDSINTFKSIPLRNTLCPNARIAELRAQANNIATGLEISSAEAVAQAAMLRLNVLRKGTERFKPARIED